MFASRPALNVLTAGGAFGAKKVCSWRQSRAGSVVVTAARSNTVSANSTGIRESAVWLGDGGVGKTPNRRRVGFAPPR